MKTKLKIVWICHFSNEEIRGILPLCKKKKYADFAPWISNLIREFEQIPDVEIHVITPHMGLKRYTSEFERRGIFYHFFKPDLPIIHKRWPTYFPLDAWTGYFKNRFLVRRFIKKIKPDLINLHGAENDYYSATVLGIKNIPIYVCIQGIYNNPIRFNEQNKPIRSRIRVERKVHAQNRYFGIRVPFMVALIERDAPDPIFFWQIYPLTFPKANTFNIAKEFDFVFFARITHVKGIEEILLALAEIKKSKPDVSLNIIGPGNSTYLNFLKKSIAQLGIAENVKLTGMLPALDDVHREAQKARFSIIVPKFDTIPGTIIESILMGLPVVTSNAGGIPYLNKDGETVLMSQPGDIEQLVTNMKRLLDDPELSERLKKAAFTFIKKEFDSHETSILFFKQYSAIISHYWNKQPIDNDLLFNKKIFGVSE